MKKKISIVTAGIILAMSMLAGCSGKTTDGQQAETVAVQTTDVQTEKTDTSQTDFHIPLHEVTHAAVS